MGVLTANWVESSLRAEPIVLWHPVGGYAIHLAEVEPEAGGAVADALSLLPTGQPLPTAPPPPPRTATADASMSCVRSMATTWAAGRCCSRG